MRYYIIAGEPSGDLHGSNLIRGIRKQDPCAEFRFWGGDLMAEAGGSENLVLHYRQTSFFGIIQVVMNCQTILRQIALCKNDILAWQPDVLVLIDYPGFNLRMAKFAHGHHIPTFYYIAPKVWAWKASRIKRIRKYVDRLFTIFPFESDYFGSRGITPVYCGNPLVDAIDRRLKDIPDSTAFRALNGLGDKPLIALVAGSRRSEITKNLPLMIRASREFPEYRFVVSGVTWLEKSLYDRYLKDTDISIVYDLTDTLIKYSEAAIVTSGTATLETALIGTPEVVCYRADPLLYMLKPLILHSYISLVNINLQKMCVAELIQSSCDATRLVEELRKVLPGGSSRQAMLADFDTLRTIIGGAGSSERTAQAMVSILKEIKR